MTDVKTCCKYIFSRIRNRGSVLNDGSGSVRPNNYGSGQIRTPLSPDPCGQIITDPDPDPTWIFLWRLKNHVVKIGSKSSSIIMR
jgi:hypothetical protein